MRLASLLIALLVLTPVLGAFVYFSDSQVFVLGGEKVVIPVLGIMVPGGPRVITLEGISEPVLVRIHDGEVRHFVISATLG